MKLVDVVQGLKKNEENSQQDHYNYFDVEFGDVTVYNEMKDQTSVKLNLIEQIHSQLAQLEEANLKRQFLMKEILQIVID